MKIGDQEWVLVPVSATDEMTQAAWDSDATDYVGEHHRIHSAEKAWASMASAAPKPEIEAMVEGVAKVIAEQWSGDLEYGHFMIDGPFGKIINTTDIARAVLRHLFGEG